MQLLFNRLVIIEQLAKHAFCIQMIFTAMFNVKTNYLFNYLQHLHMRK